MNYFDNTYLKNKPFMDRQWNYSSYLKDDNDIRKYYFTNNVVESIYRTINYYLKILEKHF